MIRYATMALGPVVGLAMLTLTAPTLQAQTMFGVRGGITVSGVDSDLGGTFDDSNRTGFTGGVFLDLAGSSPLGLQLGAQYTQKGAELDVGDTVEDFSLDYLEIPAVLKLGIPLGIMKPSLLGGVALGFRTGCENLGVLDCDEEVTSTEWAGVLGADVAFYLGGINLFVDGRYHFSLNDLSDAADVDELKNRAWALQAGLAFPVGG